MSDNLELLKNWAKPGATRPAAPPERKPEAAEEDEDSCVAFGYLRGLRDRALSLEFRFANGNSRAYPYSWLGPMQYDPSTGLLLKFVGDMIYLVLLQGSNLNALVNGSMNLYDRGILRHRVTFVRELTRRELEKAGEREVTIERIHILAHRPDEEPKGVAWLEPFKTEMASPS